MITWFRDHRWAIWILQFTLVILPLYLLIRNLIINWESLQQFHWKIDFLFFALALTLLVVAFAIRPIVMQQVLASLGYRLKYRSCYYLYHISQLAKYLPGGFWVAPGRAVLLLSFGVDIVSSGIGIVLEMYLVLVSGVVIFIPYLFLSDIPQLQSLRLLGLLVILVMFVLISPRFLNWSVAKVVKFTSKVDVHPLITINQVIRCLLVLVIFWFLTGLAFYYLILGVYPIAIHYWPLLTAIFSISWTVGFVAFVTPVGLGVREGVLALLLVPLFPVPFPTLVALLARLWWTIVDFLSIVIAFTIKPSKKGATVPYHQEK